MLNEIVLVGKITKLNLYLKEGKKVVDLAIATSRNYKNEAGTYDCDVFPMELTENVAISMAKFCEVGDNVEIKGRLANQEGEIIIIPLTITFLSSKIKDSELKPSLQKK